MVESSLVSDFTTSHKWINAICIAKFDNELGMIIEEMAPKKSLSEREANTVAVLSFPESNCSESEWENTFFYRFRRDSENSLESDSDDDYLFGYAYYLQRKDASKPRGYFQKSFVIITPFYFSGFYMKLVQMIGRIFFSNIKTYFLRVYYK